MYFIILQIVKIIFIIDFIVKLSNFVNIVYFWYHFTSIN